MEPVWAAILDTKISGNFVWFTTVLCTLKEENWKTLPVLFLETLTGLWNGKVCLTVSIRLIILTWEPSHPSPFRGTPPPPPPWDVIRYGSFDSSVTVLKRVKSRHLASYLVYGWRHSTSIAGIHVRNQYTHHGASGRDTRVRRYRYIAAIFSLYNWYSSEGWGKGGKKS